MSFRRLSYQALFWRSGCLFTAFLLNILFARYYGASSSSVIYYLINLYSFVLLMASLSIEGGMSYFLAKDQVKAGELAAFIYMWTPVLSILTLLLLKGYFHFFDSDIRASLFWLTASTYIPGQLLITLFSALFYARESPALPNIIQLAVNGILILLAGVALNWPVLIGPSTFLHLYFFGVLAAGLLLAIVFPIRFGWGLRLPAPALLKKIFGYSLVALVANVAFFLAYRMDYWFVKRYCSADELGNYIQVSKLGQSILIVPGILASVIFPRTVLEQGSSMPARVARMTRITVLSVTLLFLVVLFAGKQLFPLLLGPTFTRMYQPVLLLLPGIGFLAMLAPLSAYFAGLNRVGVNVRVALAGVVVMFAGDFLLIPGYKIAGASIVSTAAYFTMLLYSLAIFSKNNHIRPKALFIVTRADWKWLKSLTSNRNGQR